MANTNTNLMSISSNGSAKSVSTTSQSTKYKPSTEYTGKKNFNSALNEANEKVNQSQPNAENVQKTENDFEKAKVEAEATDKALKASSSQGQSKKMQDAPQQENVSAEDTENLSGNFSDVDENSVEIAEKISEMESFSSGLSYLFSTNINSLLVNQNIGAEIPTATDGEIKINTNLMTIMPQSTTQNSSSMLDILGGKTWTSSDVETSISRQNLNLNPQLQVQIGTPQQNLNPQPQQVQIETPQQNLNPQPQQVQIETPQQNLNPQPQQVQIETPQQNLNPQPQQVQIETPQQNLNPQPQQVQIETPQQNLNPQPQVQVETPQQNLNPQPQVQIETPQQNLNPQPQVQVETPQQNLNPQPQVQIETPQQNLNPQPQVQIETPQQNLNPQPQQVQIETPQQNLNPQPQVQIETPQQNLNLQPQVQIETPQQNLNPQPQQVQIETPQQNLNPQPQQVQIETPQQNLNPQPQLQVQIETPQQQFAQEISPVVNSVQPQVEAKPILQNQISANMNEMNLQTEENQPTLQNVPVQPLPKQFEQQFENQNQNFQQLFNQNAESEVQNQSQNFSTGGENFTVHLSSVENNSSAVQQTTPTQTSETAQQTARNDFNIPAQIVEQARMIRRAESTEMVINLKPEHLGTMTLKISVNQNGALNATFYSDNAQVRAIIENSLVQLKQELSDQGLKVEHVEVYAGLSDGGLMNGKGQQAWQQNQQQGNRRGRMDFASYDEDVDSIQPVNNSLSEEGVDYKV